MFEMYFQLGCAHILDPGGYDHMIFLIALCALFRLSQWKQLLILVTAFTIGHSLTLGLAAMRWVILPSDIVEFLIPVTIFLTAINNVIRRSDTSGKVHLNYVLTLFFGLIHGLGFSNYFRALLGREEEIVIPLLSFNLGVEAGQILFVSLFSAFAYLMLSVFRIRHRDWVLFISGAAAGISILLMINAKFW